MNSQWFLRGRLFYMSRDRFSELLFAMAKHASKLEKQGFSIEWANTYPDLEGWSGVMLIQDTNAKGS